MLPVSDSLLFKEISLGRTEVILLKRVFCFWPKMFEYSSAGAAITPAVGKTLT